MVAASFIFSALIAFLHRSDHYGNNTILLRSEEITFYVLTYSPMFLPKYLSTLLSASLLSYLLTDLLICLFFKSGEPVKRGQIRDLFTPELRVTTGLLWFIWYVVLLSSLSYQNCELMQWQV